MLHYLLGRPPRVGVRPGALIDPEPDARVGALTIYRMDFGGDADTRERTETDLDAALTVPSQEDHRLTWLHFEGDVPAADLARLGEAYHLHPLALEDVLNHGQRPKLDAYRYSVFASMALPFTREHECLFQQVSLFVGEDFVLSFHAGTHDVFAPVRNRIHEAQGRIAHAESDYLAYCLADVVVDTSFEVLAGYNDRLEELEDEIFDNTNRDMIEVIHAMRRRLIGMKKVLRSQSEMLLHWIGLDHDLIHADNRPYFRDAEDHARRVLDLAEGYYETAGSLLDTYLSLASTRLNEIMRMLTLIATVFMPLSFIAGVYGMNFDTRSPWNMPELGWRFGYPAVIGVMAVLVLGMFLYFRRRRWL
ncbi:magnesium/cobalt transporter CorA [Salinisphaera aquimarina]|uniref:Magnesium transport protein CorA n=1 Tax=Salinisphaera aquimarina TaxID=2094031 RepID=A0ABV7ELV5_9GAMM